MPNDLECAIFAQQVYWDGNSKDATTDPPIQPPAGGNPPTGWSVLETHYQTSEDDGFACAAYIKGDPVILTLQALIRTQQHVQSENDVTVTFDDFLSAKKFQSLLLKMDIKDVKIDSLISDRYKDRYAIKLSLADYELIKNKINSLSKQDVNNNSDSCEIVVAFRGTANPENLKTDLKLYFEKVPANPEAYSLQFVKNIMQQYPNTKITITGHSLGCVYGLIVAYAYKLPGIFFENPGLPPQYKIPSGYDPNKMNRHYLSAPNIVNTLFPKYGEQIYVPYDTSKLSLLSKRYVLTCIWSSICRGVVWGGSIALLRNYLQPMLTAVTHSEQTFTPNESSSIFHSIEREGGALEIATMSALGSELGEKWGNLGRGLGGVTGGLIGTGFTTASEYKIYLSFFHSIDNMVASFDPTTALPINQSFIKKWPCHMEGRTHFELSNALPFNPATHGIHTLFFSRPGDVLQRQINNIPFEVTREAPSKTNQDPEEEKIGMSGIDYDKIEFEW